MHGYDIPSHDRKLTYYIVGIVAGFFSIALGWLISVTSTFGIAMAAPSGVAIFGCVFFVFDRWIWKWDKLFSFGIVPIPNLSGTWKVTLKSDVDKDNIEAVMEIHQTYTRIKIRLNTNYSESASQMASILSIDPKCYKIRYEYLAEYAPSGHAVIRHYGVSAINLRLNGSAVTGPYTADYYTEQGRDTVGSFEIVRSGL